jgi:hypothetical protein
VKSAAVFSNPLDKVLGGGVCSDGDDENSHDAHCGVCSAVPRCPSLCARNKIIKLLECDKSKQQAANCRLKTQGLTAPRHLLAKEVHEYDNRTVRVNHRSQHGLGRGFLLERFENGVLRKAEAYTSLVR